MNNCIYRPAIRSGMGVWNYYVSTLTYEQIARYVKMPDEVYQSEEMSEMLQRALTDNAESIYEYLNNEKERFFNSLVLAVYDGNPKWHEGVFELKGNEFENIGILELTGKEKIFPIDGQHRVAAIKKLIERGDSNPLEEVPVIYIAHINSDDGLRRTRKLFTTLNRYAKPVKPNEIIALDEDDIVAITTRRLVEKNGYFGGGRLSVGKTEAIQKNDRKAFSSLITLNYCNTILLSSFISEKGYEKKDFQRYRKSDEINDAFYQYTLTFWKSLAKTIKAFGEYMANEPNAGRYRNEDGGNLLFRPAGLKVFVEAVNEIHLTVGLPYEQVLKKYENMNFCLTSAPWQNVLWNNGKMIMNNKKLIKSFFLLYFDWNWKDRKGKTISLRDVFDGYKALLGSDETDEEIQRKILQK